MFIDLNVVWPSLGVKDVNLKKTVMMLEKLGYKAVALNFQFDGKLQGIIHNPIPKELFPDQKIKVYSRITVTLESTPQNRILHDSTKEFDILAVRPIGEKLLQHACTDLEVDIISLDMTQRLPFYLKHTMLGVAVTRNVALEVSYAAGLRDSSARRYVINNAASLTRATRGRGILVTSEARSPLECRGGHDVVNLATFWDMKQDNARKAIGEFARAVLLHADSRRNTYRGILKEIKAEERPVKRIKA
ncbi:RNase P and RNase MRP subunit p30 [Schizosaccharomyces japonicus yFS275]|uniref:RNase P and RNase MRP subunit p30 n=1 Tax=Schizosaccharomyces japonicus (strain yFS275 / FY16936) TaxID=402676 RepID=B6K840_SCHJY|nr:RNase P and RNase MRP subunit p30 [Schizosaccharomyces japonicus yFS275]EEB09694.1 RNase P and RNase MRP subunit p30 [Schizosaccharomyces japonicus yFS275]